MQTTKDKGQFEEMVSFVQCPNTGRMGSRNAALIRHEANWCDGGGHFAQLYPIGSEFDVQDWLKDADEFLVRHQQSPVGVVDKETNRTWSYAIV